MRWPLGTKTATEREARIKALQAERLRGEFGTGEQEQRIRALEDQLGHARGELSYREQMLADGGREVLREAFRQQLLAESCREQAREGWVVMQTFQPFPVRIYRMGGLSDKLILPGPEPVRPWGASPDGEAVPPLINPSFRTVTIKRGEGYINEAGELVVVL